MVTREAKRHGQRLLLGLDQNLDLLKESHHTPTHNFLENIYDNGLVPLITKPTRISATTATLIDNILVDQQLYHNCNSGILIDNTSDHLPCYCIMRNIYPKQREQLEIMSRDIRPKNMAALKQKLADPESLQVCTN